MLYCSMKKIGGDAIYFIQLPNIILTSMEFVPAVICLWDFIMSEVRELCSQWRIQDSFIDEIIGKWCLLSSYWIRRCFHDDKLVCWSSLEFLPPQSTAGPLFVNTRGLPILQHLQFWPWTKVRNSLLAMHCVHKKVWPWNNLGEQFVNHDSFSCTVLSSSYACDLQGLYLHMPFLLWHNIMI